MSKIINFLKIIGLVCAFIPGALSAMNGHNNAVPNRVHKKAIIIGVFIGTGIGVYINRTLHPQPDASSDCVAGALYASFGAAMGQAYAQVGLHGLWQRLPHLPAGIPIDTL